MKKFSKLSIILIATLLLVLLPASLVLGDTKGNAKGEVIEIDEDGGTLTLDTKYGEVSVAVPEGFDFSTIELGMTLLAKGVWFNDTDFGAQWIKQVGPDHEDESETTEDEEKNFQNAFCTGEKETNHPLAAKIVARFGENTVDEEQVMSWFCGGHSFGQIMLALTTQMLDGSDPNETLEERKDGRGWGEIWKKKGLIGDERQGMPPGWIKKPDKALPPGLQKKTPTP